MEPPAPFGMGMIVGAQFDPRRITRRYVQSARGMLVYLLVPCVFVVTVVLIPGFLSGSSIRSLLVLASLLGVASLGQTITIVLGGIDLSIPGFIAFASVLTAILGEKGWPFWATTVLILVFALGAGALNGVISYSLAAPALIVTLATGAAVTGLALYVSKGSPGGQVPAWLTQSVSAGADTLGVPLPPVVVGWCGLGVLSWFLQRKARLARRVYAAGASPQAARLALISVRGLWALAFGISAVFASIAGILLAGFAGGVDASIGEPYLFLTVAAVVVGGNSLLGGRGSYLRTMAGAILITNLTTLLLGLGIGTEIQQVLLGVLIVLLVTIYGRELHVSARI